jgi:hypothetical protein
MPVHSFTALLLLMHVCQVSAREPSSSFLPDQPPLFGPCFFESPEDSVRFTRFFEGLVFHEGATRSDTTSLVLRLNWRESQHGGLCIVSRGDGSTLLQQSASRHDDPMHNATYFRTTAGKRGVVIAWEIPCGLICRTANYYVEE